MIRIKDGVMFQKLTPQTLFAIQIADQVNVEKETWITSVSDGSKGRVANSKHNTGNAVDLGIHNVTDPKTWADSIRVRLGPQWDVLLHSVSEPNWVVGKPKPADLHVHIEYDPK